MPRSKNKFAVTIGPAVRCGGAEHHGLRWRVRLFDAQGRYRDEYFVDEPGRTAEDQARTFVDKFRTAAAERSVGIAVTEYLDHYARFGGKKRTPPGENTIRAARSKLCGILQLTTADARARHRGRSGQAEYDPRMCDRPVRALTPKEAQRLYSARVTLANEGQLSHDTHHSELTTAFAFGRWCELRGYLPSNPWQGVLPEGAKSKGKAKLNIDEARVFARTCYSDPHQLAGVAAVACLTLGVRSNELLDRRRCDLVDGGKTLLVKFGKTANSVRPVVVPPVLRTELNRLAATCAGPDDYIFGSMTDGTLLRAVKRLCHSAGVTTVCTHGLRGTQITLTVQVNDVVKMASKGAGHGSTGVTRAHYLASGVEASARAKLMEEILLQDPDDANAEEIAAAEAEAREAMETLARLRRPAPKLSLVDPYTQERAALNSQRRRSHR